MADNVTNLYNELTKNNYDLGSIEQFKKDIAKEENRKALHNELTKNGYDLGDLNQFSSDLGYGNATATPKQPTQPNATTQPSVSTQQQANQATTPSVQTTQPQNVTPSASNVSATPATNTTQHTTATTNVADATKQANATTNVADANVTEGDVNIRDVFGEKIDKSRYWAPITKVEWESKDEQEKANKIYPLFNEVGMGIDGIDGDSLAIKELVNGQATPQAINLFYKYATPEQKKQYQNITEEYANRNELANTIASIYNSDPSYFKDYIGELDPNKAADFFVDQLGYKNYAETKKYAEQGNDKLKQYLVAKTLGVDYNLGKNALDYVMKHGLNSASAKPILDVAKFAHDEYWGVIQANVPQQFKEMLKRTINYVTKPDESGRIPMEEYEEIEINGEKKKVSRGVTFINQALETLDYYAWVLQNIPSKEERDRALGNGWEKRMFEAPWSPTKYEMVSNAMKYVANKDLFSDLDEYYRNANNVYNNYVADHVNKTASKKSFGQQLMNAIGSTAGAASATDMQSAIASNTQAIGSTPLNQLFVDWNELDTRGQNAYLAKKMIEDLIDLRENGNSSNIVEGLYKGFKSGILNPSSWDLGKEDLAKAMAIKRAIEKMTKEEKLTTEEDALMEAVALTMASKSVLSPDVSFKVGQGVGMSIPYLLEMAFPVKGGSALAKGLTKWALKKFGKKATTKVASGIFKFLGGATDAVSRAAIIGGNRIGAGAVERATPGHEVVQDEEGNFKVKTTGKSGMDPGRALAESFYEQATTYWVEGPGGKLIGQMFKPIGKGAKHLGVDLDDANSIWNKFLKKTGWNGTPTEYAEEVLTQILQTPVNETTLDANEKTGIFTLDNQVQTFLTTMALGSLLNVPNQIAGSNEKRIAKYRNNADEIGSVFVKGWDDIKDRIDNASLSDIEGVVMEEMMKGNLNARQKKAILQYAGARVMDDALMEKKEFTPIQSKGEKVIDAQGKVEQKEEEGYNATDENEQRRMVILAQQSEQEMKAMLGGNEPEAMSALNTRYGVTTAEDLVAKVVNDKSLTPEQRNTILNFINTDASKRAIEKRMADDANAQIEQVSQETKDKANIENPDFIINATLKGASEDAEQNVTIKAGNVGFNKDGSIDLDKTSETLVVVNSETGEQEMISPKEIKSVSMQDVQATIDEKVSQIKAEHQRRLTQVTTGERTFEQNQKITLSTEDGSSVQGATITGVTSAEDGTLMVTYVVDGTTEPITIPKADVESRMDNAIRMKQKPSAEIAPIEGEAQVEVAQAPQAPTIATQEQTAPQQEYVPGKAIVYQDADGNYRMGEVVQEVDPDGNVIIVDAFNGVTHQFSSAQLDQWQQEANAPQAEKSQAEESQAETPTTKEEQPQGENAPTASEEQAETTPQVESTANATNEASGQEIIDNSNEVEQNAPITPTESTPQAETPSESAPQDANDSKLPSMEAIPTDENGKKIYEQAPIEATINDIYNDPDLDEEEADAYVQARIDGATKRVAELEKKKPKMGEDRDAYVAQRDTWRAEREAEQAKLDYWQGVQEARKNSTSSAESAEATPIEPSEESVAPIVEGVEDTQEESSDNQEEKLNTKEENIEEEEANIPMANESSMPIESTEEVEEIEISKATPQAKQSIKSKPGVVKNSQSLRLPKGQVKLLDRVAKALGVQIEFVPTMQGANAKIVGNKVTVALDAEQIQRFGADGVTIVIGHELTHRIKALSNEAFEDFAHIIESILPEQFKQLMINTRIAYSRQGLNISNEALREEVVADLAGLIMTDGNLMEEFLKELEPKSTKQQILDILKQMFNALKGVFQGKTARDLANAERVLLESMKKASAVVNEDNTTEANNASEKLSIIGESGASALDRAEEATQRMDNLESARKMEKYDYPKKAIRMATGWERGADGKWRYEIEDDFVFDIDGNVDYGKRNPQRLNDYKRYKELLHKKNALAFDGEELNAEEKAEFDDLAVIWKGTKLHNSTRLKDYIDHPELFEAYPELRDVSISFDNINARGEYDSSANEITLSNTLSPNEAKSTLIHEIQHAIQKIEGFARGGNVEASKNLIRERNNKALIWSFQKNISHMAKNNPGLSPLELIDKVLARRVELTGDNIATLEEQGAIPNEDGRIKAYNLWARGYDNEGYENAYNMVLGDDAFEVYRRHAGEVESRNVQSRMGMTPDQRRATLLAETEDVARKDQIFLMENSGVSAMAEDANESVVDINEQEGQALFSLRSYNEGGRDAVQDFVNKQVDKGALTQEQANEIVTELEDIYNICEQYKDEYAPFGAWSDAKVVADERGVPVFSVIKKNGDYGMNLDFSLVCKKRRTLDAVFQEMINRGVISNFELGQVDIARINDIIREHGFETACRLCFVDSKRFRTPKVADDFANLYNELVEMSDAQLKKVIKGEAKNTVRKKTANHLLKHPEDRIKVGRDNFITAQGFEQMQVERPEILKLYNQAKGSGGPKASFGDTQYMNDIQNTNWTPEKAYAVGGVRLQSFSDYVPRMVFDYVQLIADLASKGLPVHAYTKEPIFAKQFGLTGVKINLSLVPRVDADGVAPGLDKDGNYAWQDGESFPYDEAVALQNAEGYKENVGTIAVGVSDAHIAKMLDDPNIRMVIPYHKSGLNKQVAIKNNIDAFNDYTTSQNTRKADGTKVDKKGLKGQPDFNQDIHNGMHPRDAAQKYLDWCDKKGYLPKFDQFRDHPNYYKLLEDFTTIIEVNGVEQVAPQGAVKMQFPTENDAFGSMESLVKEGLEEDAILEGNRQSKVGDIVDEIEDALADTKYSLRTNSQEVADIVAKAKADGTYMKAPNGEPTNLTEEQWANVRTKAFKDWFGDWENDPENASKVVDENGEPMVVYHGSGENSFNVFEIGDEGFHFGNYYQALMRNYMKVDHEGVIKAFYINIKNPLVINADARNWSGKGLATFWLTDEDVTNGNGAFNLKQRGGASVNPFADEREELERIASLSEGESTKEMQDFLKSKGYDGIVYLNEVEVSPDDESNLSYIAFEPNQIKSATDNVEFGEGDDIRYSLRSDVGSTESALDAMKDSSPKGWESIKNKLRGTPIWNEVAKDANYTDDDAITKESLSRLKVGIDDLTQEMADNAKGVFEKAEAVAMADRMRRALNEFDAWVEQQVAEPTEGEDVVKYSLVSDPKLIAELDASPKRIGYRNVVMNEDGTFGSPMASGLRNKGKGKVKTSSFALGEWEQAEENPDLANENGKINLVKPDGKSVDQVDYNPYIHNRVDKVNAQFKQAWERPNLVYVETEIPLADLESGYHADKAKLPVGIHSWSNGDLILSRYDKPVRIVPWEEVADDWVERFGDRGVEFDIVPPALLPILVERGVEILPPHKGMGKNCIEAYEQWKAEQEGETKYSLRGVLHPKDGGDIDGTREEYNRRVGVQPGMRRLGYKFREGHQDSMLSLKILQEIIAKKNGKDPKNLPSWQDAYIEENLMSSRNKAEKDIYMRDFFAPLMEEVEKLRKKGKMKYEEITRYMIAKHGLERNAYMAEQVAKDEADKVLAERDKQAKTLARIEANNAVEGVDYADAVEQRQAWKQAYDNAYANNKLAEDEAQDLWLETYNDAIDEARSRDYSGLTALFGVDSVQEAEFLAQELVDEVEDAHNMDNLWDKVRKATQESLATQYKAGLISRQTYEKVRDMYQYYIPLKGFKEMTADEEYKYLATNNPLLPPLDKRAMGRSSVAEDPLAMIAMDADTAIIKANRNKMKQAFYHFVKNNPSSLVSVSEQWYVKDEVSGKWVVSMPTINEDATGEEIQNAIEEHEARMKELQEEGKAKTQAQDLELDYIALPQHQVEHAVRVKINGKEYVMYINGNPRAAQALNGLTNIEAFNDVITKYGKKVNNFMAQMFTSSNPAFIFTNGARDIQWATNSVMIKENLAYQMAYAKNIAKASQVGRLILKSNKGTLKMDRETQKYFDEFLRYGGETGYTAIQQIDDYKKKVDRLVNGIKAYELPAEGVKAIAEGVEYLNRSVEDLTRFAVYMTSRQMGRSPQRSAYDAKEITVNFNKKGSGIMGARYMSTLYLFYNASIQSLNGLAKTYKYHPIKASIRTAIWVGATAMLPILNKLLIETWGDDDDKEAYENLPEWVRKNNLVFYIPGSDGKFLTLSVPHEMRPWTTMGYMIDQVLKGKIDSKDAIKQVVLGFADMLPMDFAGNGGNVAVNLTPTFAQPIAQLIANVDYFGKPIYKDADYLENAPEYTTAFKGTSPILVNASRFINEKSGGNEAEKGSADVLNPDVAQHFIESYFGGVGKFVNKLVNTFAMVKNEDMREVKNIPIVSSFVAGAEERTSSGYKSSQEYWDLNNEAKKYEETKGRYMKIIDKGTQEDATREEKQKALEYGNMLADKMDGNEGKRYIHISSYQNFIKGLEGALGEIDQSRRAEVEDIIEKAKLQLVEDVEKAEDMTVEELLKKKEELKKQKDSLLKKDKVYRKHQRDKKNKNKSMRSKEVDDFRDWLDDNISIDPFESDKDM